MRPLVIMRMSGVGKKQEKFVMVDNDDEQP